MFKNSGPDGVLLSFLFFSRPSPDASLPPLFPSSLPGTADNRNGDHADFSSSSLSLY